MALYKTTCPHCGEVAVRDYELQMTPATADGSAAYRFSCPDCCQMIARPASSRVAALLAEGGVPQTAFRLAGQPAAITHEDLLHFHELLRDDHALATFLAEDSAGDRPLERPPRPGQDRPATRRQPPRTRRWWSRRNA